MNHPGVVRVKTSSMKLVLGLGTLVLMCAAIVSSEEFEEGKHYKIIEKQSETQSDEETTAEDETSDETAESDTDDPDSANGISVVEYFSYGCNHCYRLEPFIDTWMAEKDEDVTFSRVAAPTRTDWVPYARAYYMAEALGITEKVHDLIFRAIYVNKQQMDRPRQLKRMFVNVAEVEAEKFDAMWESDKIPDMVQKAAIEMRDLGISASPTIVVNGTYLITPETAGDLGYIFDVVEFLVDKIKAEREADQTTDTNESTG
ncbi:MAG: thiol:disulfide interchange protein DsbA/DsbL [Gammaproteobacteria bacterium]|nr:thiol:disulfide interchange protein DsbA/DsbL [Gammaproteobacteria bacterium]MYF37505.1 thiol:disulfide interchange protein DsbA/DsbL [Gammaproteobacteria bacterium]